MSRRARSAASAAPRAPCHLRPGPMARRLLAARVWLSRTRIIEKHSSIANVCLAAAPHQIRTRFSGARKSLSPSFTLKASYQASMFRTTPFTRYRTGACGLDTICWRIESSVDFWRQDWA